MDNNITIPEEFKVYFWDTVFEKLDVQKDKRYIISRLYCMGDLKQLNWLKSVYKDDDIIDVALNCLGLTAKVANYLSQQYNIPKEKMAYYQNPNKEWR